MGGFLGLIEAFLAFALTMLALSMAVSAIVEVGYNLFRWRAKGLRDMVAYLFRNTIKPLWKETARANDWDEDKWKANRIDFIFDVSMAPNPQHGTADEEDVRKKQIERAEKYQGILMRRWDKRAAVPLNLLYRFFNWPFRLLFLWPSLKFGLMNLPAEDFKAKFEASTAGMTIRQASSDRNAWEKNVKAVVDAFKRLEGPTTEHFRRKSRYFSIIVGFVLAFAVNIDSFDLLNSYLTDSDLRASIIANADTYLEQARTGLPRQETQTPQVITQLETKFDSLTQALAGISIGILNEQEQAKLDSAIALVNESRATATEMRQEIVVAAQEVRSIAGNLTESFPIGWTRYPKCPIASSDARCLTLVERYNEDAEHRQDNETWPPDNWPEWKDLHFDKPQTDAEGFIPNLGHLFWWIGWGVITIIMWPIEAVVWSYNYLDVFYTNDSQGFFQWFLGVLSTGILVGLGSPFWMRVVSKLLELRRGLRGRQTPEDETPTK